MVRRFFRLALADVYAAWWWTILTLGCCLGWTAVPLLPRLKWRWRAVRGVARSALAAMGVPVVVSGLERISRGKAILTFNHSSYADVLALAAVLPGEPAFVAKKELAAQIFTALPLRLLRALFVERYDLAGSIADAEAIAAAARLGRMIVFFPEGTFTRRPGLSGFYLGAFKVAAEADLPVIPGILRGTRSILRGDQWFPRWASISVNIAEAVKPSGTDFASILRLRDAVRQAILEGCGEPDIGELVKPPQIVSAS